MQGISGAFRPQTLTALMGVTGAGQLRCPLAGCILLNLPAIPPCIFGSLCCMIAASDRVHVTAQEKAPAYAAPRMHVSTDCMLTIPGCAGKTTLMDVLAGRKTSACIPLAAEHTSSARRATWFVMQVPTSPGCK